MKKRPISVTVLAWLLILTGAVAAGFHWSQALHDHNEIWMGLVQVTALVAGVFLLRGQNWARWLAMAWIAFHVAISFGHPMQQLIVHSLLLVVFAVVLFARNARGYFGGAMAA